MPFSYLGVPSVCPSDDISIVPLPSLITQAQLPFCVQVCPFIGEHSKTTATTITCSVIHTCCLLENMDDILENMLAKLFLLVSIVEFQLYYVMHPGMYQLLTLAVY